MPETHRMPARDVPVVARADVLVAGGGPAGAAAAVAAAREGASVLLVEAAGCLGGQATSGLVGPFMATVGTEGLYDELRSRLARMGGMRSPAERAFDAEVLKLALQRLAEESGARQLLFTVAAEPLLEGTRVAGAVLSNKAGLGAVLSKVLVDATGDGDVAFQAGAPFEKGSEDGLLQASSLFFTIGGVDDEAFEKGLEAYRRAVRELARREREAGRLSLPDSDVLLSLVWKGSTLAPGEYNVNLDTAERVDGTDPRQLTEGMNLSRRRVFEAVEFLRRHLPGASRCFLARTGALFGVRETRRFRGLRTLTGTDVVDGRKFEDAIARASFFLDLHDGPGETEKLKARHGGRLRPPPDDWYEIPYGCLVPATTDGLLLAGRNVSSDREANGSLRIMPTCMALGQAAGVAAALCARASLPPRDLPPGRVQKVLRERYGLRLANDPASVRRRDRRKTS